MTVEEKRAWGEAQTRPGASKSKPAPKPRAGKSADEQIGEIYGRKGGYIRPRSQSTDHMN